MPKRFTTVRRASRFDRLTETQEKALRGETANLLLTGRFRSFTGKESLRPYFEAALKGFEADVSGFKDAIVLVDGFVLMCNARRKLRGNRSYQGLRDRLKNGFLAYAVHERLMGKGLRAWPADLGARFAGWLRSEARTDKGELLSANTARKYWGEFNSLFATLAEEPKTAGMLPDFEAFPSNPFPRAQDETKKTKSLGLENLIAILLAARAEFEQAVTKVRHAQELFEKPEVLPDSTKRSKVRYRDLDALLWHLHRNYPERFPAFTSWRNTDLALFEAINKLHGGWRNIGEYFQPFADSCVAPIVLLTIYGHFNVEPLRALRFRQVRSISVMRSAHVEVRTAVQPGKNRGSAYVRSFPKDSSDIASPGSILELMKIWTARIRGDAGIYSDCYFIFATKEGEVKAFATATLDGRSGDSKWIHHLSEFCKRHKLPDFNLRELRQTALDYGRLISDEDIRQVAALQGGSAQSLLDLHYRSDAAENRHNASVAQLQATQERFVRTKGKSHQLGSQSKDFTAATPGCKCADPYSSPIPGEVDAVLCSAFGSCPGCPHGAPQLGNARGLARLLQVRQALIEAKSNIPLERWVKRYREPLRVLDEDWIPSFAPELFEKAKRMSLPPIGVIE
jgi:hypothetical protein